MFRTNKWKPKPQKELKQQWNNLPLEKGDVVAMILAGIITFLPIVLLIGGLFYLVIWIFFLK